MHEPAGPQRGAVLPQGAAASRSLEVWAGWSGGLPGDDLRSGRDDGSGVGMYGVTSARLKYLLGFMDISQLENPKGCERVS